MLNDREASDQPNAASDEEVLTGGHLTRVVRVGDTVRREANRWTRTVQRVLKHLTDVGFEGAPAALDFDDQGREVLSFIEGEVGTGRPPSYVWSDGVLIDVARLLHRYHDAASSFRVPADAHWQSPPREPMETICHNDVAPWNTVFRAQRPVAFIDWDWAAPGPRVWDLAFVAWQFVPLIDEDKCRDIGAPLPVANRARRLKLMCEAYGSTLDEAFLTTVGERMRSTYDGVKSLAEAGDELASRLWREGAGEGILREMAFVKTNALALVAGDSAK